MDDGDLSDSFFDDYDEQDHGVISPLKLFRDGFAAVPNRKMIKMARFENDSGKVKSQMTPLDLRDQQLDKIPKENLKQASQYDKLLLSCNQNLQMTEEIKSFVKLVELIAVECGIRNVPGEITSLKLLQKLSLFNNPSLKTFPEAILKLKTLTELNLGQCDLSGIPKGISDLAMLEKLHLRGNRRLRQLPPEVFNLTKLKEFNASNCGLTSVPQEIAKLSQLEKLHLFGNSRLRCIPPPIFSLHSLKDLNVGCCGLNDVPEGIKNLTKLTSLHLHDNTELQKIPAAVFGIRGLRELNVANCGLSEIPAAIASLTQLERLLLFRNRNVQTLPPAVYGLSKLRELNASFCSLSSIDSIGRLATLENLHLRGNNDLRQMTPGIFLLRRLKELNMSQCGLTAIPSGIEKLSMLKKLHLFDNPGLQILPQALAFLVELEEINISNSGLLIEGNVVSSVATALPLRPFNKLRKLQLAGCSNLFQVRDISELATLTAVDLSRCSLTSIPFNIASLNKLIKLELGFNELQQMSLTDVFKLSELQELGIGGCNLTEIPEKVVDLPNLKKLDVHANPIRRISPTVFRQLDKLTDLNLSACGLTELPEQVSELKYLVSLDLSENQLTTLPGSASNLNLLQNLDISSNSGLANFPLVVASLPKLKELIISCCGFSVIPQELEKMSDLEVLVAQNIALEEYPVATLNLKNLKRLDLSNMPGVEGTRNNLKELPARLRDTQIEELLLHGNPMSRPPVEICEQGMAAVRRYLTDIIPGSQLICAETVNMLGDTGAGKTSIVNSLMRGYPCATNAEDRTRVMDQFTVPLLNDDFVNVNDFGGHEIYQTVLPMFLPPKGLGILAYDMSEPLETQLDKVDKWVATVLAKSPGIRLLVAGTHADRVGEQTKAECEQKVKDLVDSRFKSAEGDIDDHINGLKYEIRRSRSRNVSAANAVGKLKFMEEALKSLKSSKRMIVSLSCKEGSPADGLLRLHDIVSANIKPPDPLPASWCHVMKDILHFEEHASYLMWHQAKSIFHKYLSPEDDDDDEKLKTILRYLVATSKVIWLEDHATLGNHIFHRIGHILDMCKQVLHHDKLPSRKDALSSRLRGYAERYSTGHLCSALLQHLLKDHSDEVSDVITDLMLQFNLISKVNGCDLDHDWFIIPSLLEDKPSEDVMIPDHCCSFLPTVHLRLHFGSSVIPLALFETSLASVLSWVYKERGEPKCWKHGVSFRIGRVTVTYRRIADILDVEAKATTTPKDLWNVFHYVLRSICGHVVTMWKGAMPRCEFVCPGCRCCGKHATDPKSRESSIEELAAVERRPASSWFCSTCKKDIPYALVFHCQPEWMSNEDNSDVATFMDDLRSKCAIVPDSGAVTKQKIQKAGLILLEELEKADVTFIADVLTTKAKMEIIEREKLMMDPLGRRDRIRRLLDFVAKRGEDVAVDVLDALRSPNLNKAELVDRILNQ